MIKKALLCVLLAALACPLSGCGIIGSLTTPAPEPPQAVYRKITAEQARTMMEEGVPFILLDVRTGEEFSNERIEGAILIPDFEIGDRVEAELPDKDALILVYCRSGRRSANAVQAMAAMGYTNAYDFGGILDWPFDTVGGQ